MSADLPEFESPALSNNTIKIFVINIWSDCVKFDTVLLLLLFLLLLLLFPILLVVPFMGQSQIYCHIRD